jgi:dihydropteroate synthase
MARWEARGRTILADGDLIPKVMGILNLTPDSFSDGGVAFRSGDPVELARRVVEQGADILDIGGESSRPGAEPVPLCEEQSRVLPVVADLASRITVPISIDTTKAEVAGPALSAGAAIINDTSALRADPSMAGVVARFGAGVCLMHMKGVPSSMQLDPRYDDVVREVYDFLAHRVEWAEAHGISRERIAIDPGIGFGKTMEHNLEILRNLHRFAKLGCVIVVGVSRKGFLGALAARPVGERAAASVAASLAACVRGARVVRVHDVAPMADAIRVWTALRGWEESQ